MNAQSMANRIKAYLDAVSLTQGPDPVAALAHRDAALTAMCQGIIDEIQQAAVVTIIEGVAINDHGEIE